MVAGHPMIEVRGLHRYFGRTRAVNDISFAVSRGQVFGFIGPNGAGKTTSMRILATLDLPTHGDAFVDGFSVIDDPDRVRRRLGFMPDYFGTYANINVREYLDFFARAYGLRGGERQRALRYVMSFTQLDTLAEKPINGLSKGMKQRLCLGRAMIHDPAVMVLDEPAAGLDPRARIQLREMIRQLAADGKAILISSHILTELAEMCDMVGIIELGRLLAVGSVDEIQRGQQAGHESQVQVRLLDAAGPLAAWLAPRPGVLHVYVEGDQLSYVHGGSRDDEAATLRAMIEAGFRVASFGHQTKTLEEVFMQVTKGHVQ
ncbi:MAG TPA: ABC transporter ATP-binding protein [Pirellulales bacterium]|nr:ABC transporter ATP-binding protein [Pirellulales bacterium]